MKAGRTPNLHLRSLLDEAGWTGQRLAHAVNAEGARHALTVSYDRSSVAHWLAGTTPRPQVAALVCAVLSQALGRPVEPVQVWPEPAARDAASQVTDAPGESLRSLTDHAPRDARTLHRLSYDPFAELPEPGTRPGRGAGLRIGSAHVRSARRMVTLFSDFDEFFGGARLRPVLTSYLSTDVAAHLDAPAAPGVSREFRQAACDLVYLAGFTSFDEHLHGAAQAYFRIAAQLASEVRDHRRYALALRQMSVQAHYLGNTAQSLHCARVAARAVGSLPPQTAAFVVGQLALALAASGERRQALTHLGRAERLLERSEGHGQTLGGYHLAALAHQQAEVLAAAGDLPSACAALTLSLRHRPDNEGRARMLTTARLAELQLAQGHLELACGTWEKFLDDYPQIESARGDRALRELRSRLRPYQRERSAQRVLSRAAEALRAQRVPPPRPPGWMSYRPTGR